MMIKIMVITIEEELTSATKNAKIIFENVTARTFKQSHYKNPAWSVFWIFGCHFQRFSFSINII